MKQIIYKKIIKSVLLYSISYMFPVTKPIIYVYSLVY